MTTDTEESRRIAFRACPILCDYLSTALQDLQFSESDEACMEEREARDSGTIYDCPDDVFRWAQSYCEQFMTEQASNIECALELEHGSDGLRYERAWLSHERIGSTLYLASVGHGVTFTDDGNAPCLKRMADWARANQRDSLYFGDDGKVYHV